MSIITDTCSFFDHVKYAAQEFLNRDADFIGNGVLTPATDFELSSPATPDMTMNVTAGTAWVNGYRIGYLGGQMLTFTTADATNPRIDLVEVGYTGTGLQGEGVIQVVTGTPAASPIQPQPDAGFIALFAVAVAANATALTSGNVTDLRVGTSRFTPYAVDTGIVNTYAVTFNPAPTALIDGMAIRVKIAHNSTGASTLNVNSLGAKPIVGGSGNAIIANGLIAGMIYTFCYDATNGRWILQGKDLPNLLFGTLANRPAAGTANRMYFATDTGILSFDTGTAWVDFTGSSLSLAHALTVNGLLTAAAYISAPVNPNLLFNPSFRQGAAGWSGVGSNGFFTSFGGNGEGGFLYNTTSAAQVQVSSSLIPCGSGQILTLSGELYTVGVTAGVIDLLLIAYNSSQQSLGQTGSSAHISNGETWTPASATITTPANTAYVQVVCYMESSITNTGCGWRKIKLEAGSVATMFSDDQGAHPATLMGSLEFEVATILATTTAGAVTTTSTSAVAASGAISLKNVAEYVNYYFEAIIWNTTSGDTVYAELHDDTLDAAVSGSLISGTSTTQLVLRSGALSLTAGHTYSLWLYCSAGTAYCNLARIVGVK